jgi:hypothetical protein
MPAGPDASQIDRFYVAAMLGLGALEARAAAPRRFGADADARWNSFRGGLQDWHRVELLVRDAAVRSPAGFAPRVVFDLPALADDEPCGPDWPAPSPTNAAALLRTAQSENRDPLAALAAAAEAWGLHPASVTSAAMTGIAPATRLLIAGSGAVLAAASVFIARPELDLADQSVLLADDPGTRQLFGLAIALLDSRRPPRVARTTASAEDVPALGMASADRLLVGDDLAPDVKARVSALATALGVRL